MNSGSSSAKRKREDVEWNDDMQIYEGDITGGFMDDDSEPHRFGASALPVPNLPASFNGVPKDGLEYLFTVRREERQLPLVTRAHNPYALPETNHTHSDTNGKANGDTSLGTIPSDEWRTCFEERFRNLRANMRQPTIHIPIPNLSASNTLKIPETRERNQWWAFFRGDTDWETHGKNSGKNERRKWEPAVHEGPLPQEERKMRAWVVYEEKLSWDQADEDGVAALSYGDGEDMDVAEEGENKNEDGEIDEGSLKGKEKEITEETSLPTPRGSPGPAMVPTPHPATSNLPCPREPTPHLLSLLDQKTTFQLLRFFSQWIQGHFDYSFLPAPPPSRGFCDDPHSQGRRSYGLTPSHARWIFALLSHLDARLTSDEISVLRKLAREVIRVIKEERLAQRAGSRDSVAMGETACWMIIAAITGVWGQKDLWTDAEDALR